MNNSPKKYIDDKSVNTLRSAVENQGKWIYFLTSEGIERGISPDFAKDAMRELGEYYANTVYKNCDTPEKLVEGLASDALVKGSEAVVSATGDGLELEIGYCPMLNLWNQVCDDGGKKEMLCGISCEMYRGIANSKGFCMEKDCSIASGCDKCRIKFTKPMSEEK